MSSELERRIAAVQQEFPEDVVVIDVDLNNDSYAMTCEWFCGALAIKQQERNADGEWSQTLGEDAGVFLHDDTVKRLARLLAAAPTVPTSVGAFSWIHIGDAIHAADARLIRERIDRDGGVAFSAETVDRLLSKAGFPRLGDK